MTHAIVGVGQMGEAILAGLVSAGWNPADITVTVRRDERAQELAQRYGVRRVQLAQAARHSEVLVVGVKPHDVARLLDEVTNDLRKGTVVVSLAAGLTTETLEEHLPGGTPVVRVMPNTPALVGKGMSGISGGRHARPEHVEQVRQMMAAVGRAVVVPEHQLDALTAVSGSGPAYVFYVAEAMVEAGVQLGLARPLATELTTQTLLGAAEMLARPGVHPSILRENVTSPGGTTAQALKTLDDYRVRAAFAAAMEACRDRSVELGEH